MFQSRIPPEYMWEFVYISLELLFGFTMVVLLAELSEELGTLSFVGWTLTFTLAFIFILLDYNIRRILYYINRELSIKMIRIYQRRDLLIIVGFIILVFFAALGFWELRDIIYIYKACIGIFCWMIFPIVSGAIASHVWGEVTGEE
jgi:hypothetical protein